MASSSLRIVWRGSWMVLLPLLAIFLYWASNTWQRYTEVSLRQLGIHILGGMTLKETGDLEFGFLRQQIKADLSRALFRGWHSKLPNISLYVSEGNKARLDSNLPGSGKEYVSGVLIDNGTAREVKVRYRGDFHMHWSYPKKSWRVKTKKKHFYQGMRRFNLVISKTASIYDNYVGYEIAELIGLIVPRHDLVTTTINGKFQGHYLLVEQIDESLLREHNLLPGDIYKGDQIFGAERWEGISSNLFKSPGLWDKIAVDNHFPQESHIPLTRLLEAIQLKGTEQGQQQLETLLDLEMFARLDLLQVLLVTRHYDNTHNWRLYFDPGRHKFMPIIWDPLPWFSTWGPDSDSTVWRDGVPPPYIMSNEIQSALFRSAAYMRVRGRVFEEYFSGDKPDEIVPLLRSLREKIEPSINAEIHLMDEKLELVSPRQAVGAMQEKEKIAGRVVAGLRTYYLRDQPTIKYRQVSERSIVLSLNSHRLAHAIRFKTKDDPGSVHLEVLAPNEQTVDVSHLKHRDSAGFTIELGLTGNVGWTSEDGASELHLASGPATYAFAFEHPIDLQGVDVRMLSGDIEAARDESIELHPFNLMRRVTALAPPAPAEVVWKGTVSFPETTRMESPVRILAGTRVKLGEAASLFFSKPLTIEGTTSAPVIFEGDGSKPWGAVILHGKGVNGSRLSHFEMHGGSGLTEATALYSGMLSIHDTRNVVLEHCSLHDNFRYDDMLHVVYGELTINDCRFEGAVSDAVDLDISTAHIIDSLFVGNGNDGLDLMSTTVLVQNSGFERNGDKGISVGERSNLSARHLTMRSNVIAIQSKDDSVALIQDSTFEDNGTAIDALQKNWRYGTGGSAYHCGSIFLGNDVLSSADKKSLVDQTECRVDIDPLTEVQQLRAQRN